MLNRLLIAIESLEIIRTHIKKEYIVLVMIGIAQDIIVTTLENVQMVPKSCADAND